MNKHYVQNASHTKHQSYLHSNYVLSIDFGNEVINQDPIACSRRILNNLNDLAITEGKAHMVVTVLLHRDGPLKRTITNSQGNIVYTSLLDDLIDLVLRVARHRLPIDLHNQVKTKRTKIIIGRSTKRMLTLTHCTPRAKKLSTRNSVKHIKQRSTLFKH